MRSSLAGSHISGAERLSDTLELPQLTAAMTSRALCHDKGVADNIHITVEKIESDAVSTVPALEPVQTDNASPESAQALVATLLKDAGITAAEQAVALAYSLTGLRGAALVDAVEHPASDCAKDHFHEAIILASIAPDTAPLPVRDSITTVAHGGMTSGLARAFRAACALSNRRSYHKAVSTAGTTCSSPLPTIWAYPRMTQ